MTGRSRLWQRFRARLNLVPCLSSLINPIGIPLGIWAIVTLVRGSSPLPPPLLYLSAVAIAGQAMMFSLVYTSTWRRTAIVLSSRRDRLRYLLRVSPPVLYLYWVW